MAPASTTGRSSPTRMGVRGARLLWYIGPAAGLVARTRGERMIVVEFLAWFIARRVTRWELGVLSWFPVVND